MAWDEAKRVWDRGATPAAVRASERKLDWLAAVVGDKILDTPVLLV